MEIRDKVVVITGAARGIGQELAWRLAAAGARIVAADSDLVGAILWLVSDASSLVTGQTIAIDGGTVLL